jgi:hypothetical protein
MESLTASGHPVRMTQRSLVTLPRGIGGAYDVYLNGVRQQEGVDFVRESDSLVFERPLAKEGRLGFWRWVSLFLGIAGTYRQNDSVDVVYHAGGRRLVATGLPIIPDQTGGSAVHPDVSRRDADEST